MEIRRMVRRPVRWVVALVACSSCWLTGSQPAQAGPGGSKDGAFREVRQITTDPKHQIGARISGNFIVWEDWRHEADQDLDLRGEVNENDIAPNTEIYLHNLAATSNPTLRLTVGNRGQFFPDVSGDRVVWEDWRRVSALRSEIDIWSYQISRGRTLRITNETNDATAVAPRVSGELVAWADDRNDATGTDIFWSNFVGVPPQLFSHPVAGEQELPAIGGTLMAWEDLRQPPFNSADIFARATSGAERPVSTAANVQEGVAVSNGVIMWVDRRSNPSGELFISNGPGHEQALGVFGPFEGALSTINEIVPPELSGSQYVYVRSVGGGVDLFLGNVTTGTQRQLVASELTETTVGSTTFSIESNVADADIDGNRVVWTWYSENDNGTPDNFDDDTDTSDVFYGVINQPPVAASLPTPITAPAGTRVQFSLSATDADGDALTYAVTMLPDPFPGASLSGPTFTWDIPATMAPGSYVVILEARDPFGAKDDSGVLLNVTSNPLRVLTPNGGQVWQAGTTQTIQWTGGVSSWLINLSLVKAGDPPISVVSGTLNDGTHTWTIPTSVPPGPYVVSLVCQNCPAGTPGASDASDAAFTVSAPAPVLTFGAIPTSIQSGQSSTLNWSTAYATSCTASGGWSGAKAIPSGNQAVSPTTTTTYNLACTGTGGTVTKSVTISVGQPDLIVESITMQPSQVYVNQTATYYAVVRNIGGSTASASWVEFWMDDDPDTAIWYSIPPLQPTQSVLLQRTYTFTTAGTHYAKGSADATGGITEANENNNTRVIAVNVLSIPVAYTLTASPTTVIHGNPITVNWTAPTGHSASDWIGLYAVGASNFSYLSYRYTNSGTYGTVTFFAPTTPGNYELRFLLNNGFTEPNPPVRKSLTVQ